LPQSFLEYATPDISVGDAAPQEKVPVFDPA